MVLLVYIAHMTGSDPSRRLCNINVVAKYYVYSGHLWHIFVLT